jgi:hypothetical protein
VASILPVAEVGAAERQSPDSLRKVIWSSGVVSARRSIISQGLSCHKMGHVAGDGADSAGERSVFYKAGRGKL